MEVVICTIARRGLLTNLVKTPQKVMKSQKMHNLVPASQYDSPLGSKMNPFFVMVVHWETSPLFASCLAAVGMLVGAIVWACYHKVDIVFSAKSRNNLSRTMDLRYPASMKFITVEQEYHPWPLMQQAVEAVRERERQLITSRKMYCHFVDTVDK